MTQNEGVQTFLSAIPGWVLAGGAVILAILIGIWAHRVFVRVAGRATRDVHPIVRSLFDRTAGPARLAFILLAIWLVMPFMPAAGLGGVFGKLFMVAVIALIGWAAINAVGLGAELYLKGFEGKTADDPMARMHETLVRVLERCAAVVIVLVTAGFALMTFEAGSQIGFSLFGTAGVAALVVAFAAYTILKNLIAGIQLAMTQPVRIGDTVEVEGQTGQIHDITASHVALRLVDGQMLMVPLYVFMEKPFQNLTRGGAGIQGTVTIHADYSVPVERVRQKLTEIVKNDPLWDGRVADLQVTDAKDWLELCATVSAATPRKAWDLRCAVREKLVAFLQREHPHALAAA
jgi:small-conductance mechanosensitive channel